MKKDILINFRVLILISALMLMIPSSTFAKEVRVAVIKNEKNFVVSASGQYTIAYGKNMAVFESDRKLNKSRVLFEDDMLHIGKRSIHTKFVRITSDKDITLFSGNKRRRYRGSIDIKSDDQGNLTVTNSLELEQYVKGVLYHEVSARWPMEAMKAQAVATRTYVLYQVEQNQKLDYDVTSDIYSQVYGGKSAERFRTNLAVDRTKGQILKYKGKILPTYFHSNSGGHTEDVSELWNHDLPPLKGVESPYSLAAPNYEWKKNFRSKDVQDLLNKAGIQTGLIKEIRVLEKNDSGRNRWLEIESRNGQLTKIAGKKFREFIGPNDVKSNMYDIEMKGYYFDLIGKGWGHGVGMCQWGAYEMARQRFRYDSILQFYYPQSDLTKI